MLKPDYYVDTVFNIDLSILKAIGIKNILIDIDNTIVPFREKLPSLAIKEFIEEGKDLGLSFCIVSNTFKQRVKDIGDFLEIPYVHMAKKPSRKGLKKALLILDANEEESILIGDQFCTDIIAAKRTKIKCILVEPITTSDFFMTRIYRVIEWFFKKDFKKENMK